MPIQELGPLSLRMCPVARAVLLSSAKFLVEQQKQTNLHVASPALTCVSFLNQEFKKSETRALFVDILGAKLDVTFF